MVTTTRPGLGEFLRSRRMRTSPADVGLPAGSDRRVSGLRREEVALLANVSVDYYVRLEQGRAAHPSTAVLDSLASALRLTPTERDHLLSLAAPAPRRRPEPAVVRSSVVSLVQSMRETPAVVLDRLTNILTWNAAAAAVVTDFAALAPTERNLARLYFLDPAAADFYVDWPTVAKDAVAQLRRTSADYAEDPALAELVADLSQHPLFAEWWSAQDVRDRSFCPKVFNHPRAGRLAFTVESLDLPSDDGQYLITFTPADRATTAALEDLLRESSPV